MNKEKKIEKMFSSIAKDYDFLNHFLSFGMDIVWRKKVANFIYYKKLNKIADIACGTGDLSIEINKKINREITGVDFCYEMLKIAKKKTNVINLINGDGTSLPLVSEYFDVVTIAFGIRNIPDRETALNEFYRIIKNKGYLLILEFDIPDNFLFKFYFKKILPFIGGFFSSKEAYEYLPDSVSRFPREKEFKEEIIKSGFNMENVVKMSFGMVKLYIAVKSKQRIK